MINKKELCEFLVEAKKSTYASGDNTIKIIEENKSTTLVFEKGNFKYNDNYFGGEPFGGREVVFFNNEPVYIMTYYGFINESVSDFGSIYKILQKALSEIPEDYPFRGPKEYSENNYKYVNNYNGEVDNFFGEEIISENGKELYRAKYIGGFVDIKR
ncbi:DUF5680 domain-containing protein [Patescibacteria group bacterium]|nr:DUF5680 domain-containing protein [Patescibacteria group bacterium]